MIDFKFSHQETAERTSIVKIQQPKKDTTNMLNQSKCCGMI